jgi:hypothetical protein
MTRAGRYGHSCVAGVFLLWPAMASSQAPTGDDLLQFFNTCAGQIAGHISTHGGRGAGDATFDLLQAVEEIVDTLAAAEDHARLQAARSAARAAHLALVADAMANGDLAALDRATEQVDRCRRAVLPRD